jgi:hypothetical protein
MMQNKVWIKCFYSKWNGIHLARSLANVTWWQIRTPSDGTVDWGRNDKGQNGSDDGEFHVEFQLHEIPLLKSR